MNIREHLPLALRQEPFCQDVERILGTYQNAIRQVCGNQSDEVILECLKRVMDDAYTERSLDEQVKRAGMIMRYNDLCPPELVSILHEADRLFPTPTLTGKNRAEFNEQLHKQWNYFDEHVLAYFKALPVEQQDEFLQFYDMKDRIRAKDMIRTRFRGLLASLLSDHNHLTNAVSSLDEHEGGTETPYRGRFREYVDAGYRPVAVNNVAADVTGIPKREKEHDPKKRDHSIVL